MVPFAGHKPPVSGVGYYLENSKKEIGTLVTHFVWHSVSCACRDCIAVDLAYERYGLLDDVIDMKG